MSNNNHQSPLALAYATALLDLVGDPAAQERIAGELADLAGVIAQMPQLRQFFADPSFSAAERLPALQEALKGSVHPLLFDTLRLMNQRGELAQLAEIAQAYRQLLDRRQGRVEVEITVAHPLNEQELRDVESQIGTALKKQAVVKQQVDERIVGGLVIRVGDRLIDGSVRAQLRAMKDQLLSARTRQPVTSN